MKVLLVSTRDLGGGAARSTFRLHKGLRRIGVESSMLVRFKQSADPHVHVIRRETDPASRERLEGWKKLSKEQIDANRQALGGDALFTLPVPGYDLARHPLVQEADVLNLHWTASLISPKTLGGLLRLGKPIVWTLHDQRPFTGGCHFSFGCVGYEKHCADCPHLRDHSARLTEQALHYQRRQHGLKRICPVAPSHWMAGCARRSTLFKNSRVVVIPNSLEVELFRPQPRRQARESLGLNPEGFWFLFGAHGIANKRKGFATLMEAARRCMEDPTFSSLLGQDLIRFVGFGGGERAPDFAGVPVTNIGFISSDQQLACLYAAADLFLCPTLEDNLPNTILEALSCGTPVLASRVGGVCDLVEDGVNGCLFQSEDAEAMSRLMIEHVKNPQSLEPLALAARRDVEARFPLEVQARAYAALFEELNATAASRKTPPPVAAKLPLLPMDWSCHHPLRARWVRLKNRCR